MEDIEIIVEEEIDITVTIDENTAYVIEVPGVSAASVLTTTGDLLGYSTLPERHPIGVDDQVLTVDSTVERGLTWKDLPEVEASKIFEGNSSVEVIDEAAGQIVFTTDTHELMTMETLHQPITISHPMSYCDNNTPIVEIEASGSVASKGAVLRLVTGRDSSVLEVDTLRINNADGRIYSIDNLGNTYTKEDILPISNNVSNLGSATKTLANLHLTDENNDYFTARQMFKLHRDYSECAAITPYTLSSDVSSGVWTITLTADPLKDYIAFVFNNVIYRTTGTTISVNATSYAGTDTSPKAVYIYVTESGGVPILNVSNTNPYGVITYFSYAAGCIAGAVSTSSINIYSHVQGPVEMANLADNLYRRVFRSGALYVTGLNPSATTTSLSVATGVYTVAFDDLETSALSSSVDGFFIINNDGTYTTKTDFSFTQYSTGETISNNKYYNVVFGVCSSCNTTELSTNLIAIVQAGDVGSEYVSAVDAREDINNALRTVPSNSLIANSFIPVARTVIKNDASNYLQAWPSGNYYLDIRTEGAGAGGSGGTSSPLTTKGDVYTYSTAEARLAVGSDGEVLVADSSETTGLKWATVSGASGASDKIYEDDSSVEVVDNGTDAGTVNIAIDDDGTVSNAKLLISVTDAETVRSLQYSGYQLWNLRSSVADIGRLQFANAGGWPGMVIFTGTTFADNRLNIVNAGTYYYIRYHADSNTLGGINVFAGGGVSCGTTSNLGGLTVNGNIVPSVDDTHDLGTSTYRFDDVYATNTTIQTSDGRLKDDIATSKLGLDFINSLNPVSFKWKDYTVSGTKTEEVYGNEDNGNYDVIDTIETPYTEERTFSRTHYGMIAQEVEKTIADNGLSNKDFAAIIYDEENDKYGLRYGEFIAPLIKAIQEMSTKNNELKTRLEKLETKYNMLTYKLDKLEEK